MKNMYKGVLTVAVATAVASAAIMMSGKKTSAEADNVAKATQNTTESTAVDGNAANVVSKQTSTDAASNIVKQAVDTVDKTEDSTTSAVVKGATVVAATGAAVVAATSANAKDAKVEGETAAEKSVPVEVAQKQEATETTADANDDSLPPPPPGPFTEKKEGETTSTATIKQPAAPIMPDALAAPKAPAAPALVDGAMAKGLVGGVALDKAAKTEMKAPIAPTTELSVPQAPSVSEEVIEGATESKKVVEAPSAPEKSKVTGDVVAEDKAPAVKSLDVPVKMETAKKPEIAAPQAPKTEDHLAKPAGMPQVKVSEPAKNQLSPLPQPVMPQMMMPQGMSMPPQGMMMAPPQMLNGQRVIMVPVYPMNMGRPSMPSGIQMPSFGMPPQGNIQQQPPKPASQQQTAEETAPAKVETAPKD